MPLFEYRCEACGHEFESLVRSSQRDMPQACRKCEHPVTHRIISSGSFVLKGGGWAKDGYAKE
jgi:putative FmdB family regulatory protein